MYVIEQLFNWENFGRMTTTVTGTDIPEQNNGCARALLFLVHFFAFPL